MLLKILKDVLSVLKFCISCCVLWGSASILYTVFVGPESYYWPKSGWGYLIPLLYGWFWSMFPSDLDKWREKNPGKNMINYLWSW